MARAARRSQMHNLFLRLGTALVLVPAVVWAIIAGDWMFYSMLLVVAALMAGEWVHITRSRIAWRAGLLLVLIVVGGLVSQMAGGLPPLMILAGACVVALLAGLITRDAVWILPAGALYILMPLSAAIWFRADSKGALALFYILLVVIATDSAAMLVGRQFGRTQLAPRLSPKKSWEGLGGGVLAAAFAGGIFAWWLQASVWMLGLLAAGFALCAQGGGPAGICPEATRRIGRFWSALAWSWWHIGPRGWVGCGVGGSLCFGLVAWAG